MPTRTPKHRPLTHASRVHVAPNTAYTSSQRGYGSRWQRARDGWLRTHPLCVMCEQQGRITAATVVDHIVPHRTAWALASGDAAAIAQARARFWDRANWQSLCASHHDGAKQAIERASMHRGGAQNLWPGISSRPAAQSNFCAVSSDFSKNDQSKATIEAEADCGDYPK